MNYSNEIDVFYQLVRAGLWGGKVELSSYGDINFYEVYNIAQSQTVIGLVAGGFEHVIDIQVSKDILLLFAGQVLQFEQRNTSMNYFIGLLVEKLRETNIKTLLVKGQGIAQCYERPLWRMNGDVDLLLNGDNYKKAIDYLVPLSSFQYEEGRYSKHLGLSIWGALGEGESSDREAPWFVELHGTLRTGLSARVDKLVDAVQNDTFDSGNVRTWMNGETSVYLPAPDNDAIFVFTHFLMHFYREQMTLRQACDWCRLLWTYRGKIDVALLERRLIRAGLISEWRGFAALAVNYLGMPRDAMPLYDADTIWSKNAEKLVYFLVAGYTGNRVKDTWEIAKIFPWKTLMYSPSIFLNVNWLKIKERLFGK